MIPKIQITDAGYIVPTTQEINVGVWRVLRDTFGENISQVQGTPQYQLATSITAIIRDIYDHDVQLANQFDPRYAQGIYQDAIGELYFMQRKIATRSLCEVVFEGLSGSPIPAGFIVQDVAGNQWETTGAYNIGANGTVKGTVICLTAGAIEANPNSITIIPSALVGLDRVYNEDSALPGYNEESRQDFEMRRRESVAINAKMTDDAVRGAVLNVRDVIDCYAISNPTDTTVTFGATNYPAIRNSIVVSVVGGNDYDVAKEAFIKAGTGCSWNGNTDVTVIDDSYDGENKPEYPIKILRPTLVDVYFRVTLLDLSKSTVQDQNAAKQTIINGLRSGQHRARIGGTLVPAVFMCGMPSMGIIKIEVSTDGSTWQDKIEFGIDEFPTADEFRITFVGV